MPQLILLIIARAAHLMSDPALRNNVTTFDDAVRDLVAQLEPDLPKKPDGTAFTVEEIQAAAAEARKPWQNVLDRTAEGEGDGA